MVPLLHLIGSSRSTGSLCTRLHSLFPNVTRWKSVPFSALSFQMSLGGSLCLSLHSLSKFCVVPQDSASNTLELMWNGGSVKSVFLKTVPQIHPN
ncbi:UNVERIFIED_CONTAM: hypothetical protein Sradi_6941700 [Sesamum radiatum]|uniref:Uncharacterized protein n=1 Tax=Sesamum radiatum TaxID=300843 RepID=A0AAW2JF95_SESRA